MGSGGQLGTLFVCVLSSSALLCGQQKRTTCIAVYSRKCVDNTELESIRPSLGVGESGHSAKEE